MDLPEDDETDDKSISMFHVAQILTSVEDDRFFKSNNNKILTSNEDFNYHLRSLDDNYNEENIP